MTCKMIMMTVIFYSFILGISINGMEMPNNSIMTSVTFFQDIFLGKKNQTESYTQYQSDKVLRRVSLRFSENGEKLIIHQEDSDKVFCYDNSITIWDMLKQKELNIPVLPSHDKNIYSVCFDKTGTRLARSNAKDIYVCNMNTLQEEFHFKHNDIITNICFNNQSTLYVGDMNGQVTKVDTDKQIVMTEKSNPCTNKPINRIKDMYYNETSSHIVTVNYNDCVRICNRENETVATFIIKSNEVQKEDYNYHKICSDTKGEFLLVMNNDQQAFLINIQNKTIPQHLILPIGHSLKGIYFDTREQKFKLLLDDNDNIMHVYDIEQKCNTLSVKHDLIAHSAVIDPLGKFLVITGEHNGNVLVKLFKILRLFK